MCRTFKVQHTERESSGGLHFNDLAGFGGCGSESGEEVFVGDELVTVDGDECTAYICDGAADGIGVDELSHRDPCGECVFLGVVPAESVDVNLVAVPSLCADCGCTIGRVYRFHTDVGEVSVERLPSGEDARPDLEVNLAVLNVADIAVFYQERSWQA